MNRTCIRDLSAESQAGLRPDGHAGSFREGGAAMQGTPWVVVEADDKQTIQREFAQGEIVDQFPSKGHPVFLVQTPKVPSLPNTVLQGPIYGVGIFRDERKARTLAKHLAEI
jgi:hypothetical protein